MCFSAASVEKEMVAVEVERMLTLAEQCLERAKSFVGKSAEPQDLPASAFSSSGLSEPPHTENTGKCILHLSVLNSRCQVGGRGHKSQS